MTVDRAAHWNTVYTTKRADEVSWFQPEATTSLALIRRVAPARAAAIVDVGGGASRLVDGLHDAGYRAITVLDVSGAALEVSRQRLGPRAADVTWIESDVLEATLGAQTVDVWHDRAVFHFLTDADDRARYVAQVDRALKPGGHVVIATFADDGPLRCSGLPVVRYTSEALQRVFGAAYRLESSLREAHVTPGGTTQAFVYAVFVRVAGQPG